MTSTKSESVRNHRDLLVWQRAMELVVECYQLTRSFPKSETYGLSSQLQRAAVSVPANIAEGHGRRSTKSYLQFLSIATGSLSELDTHVELAHRLGYVSEEYLHSTKQLLDEVGRMLSGLRRSLDRI